MFFTFIELKYFLTVTITVLDNVNLEANQHFNLTMHCFFVINVISFITMDITSYEAPAVGRARNTGMRVWVASLSQGALCIPTSSSYLRHTRRNSGQAKQTETTAKKHGNRSKTGGSIVGFFGQCWRVYLYKSNLQFKRKMSLQLRSLKKCMFKYCFKQLNCLLIRSNSESVIANPN